MHPTSHHVPVLALVCLSAVSAFAVSNSRRQSSSEPRVLGPVSELDIVNRVIAPDGFSRSTVLAGGTFPGPLISAQKGDDFKINVVNWLNDDNSMNTTTSVHWHGIYQKGSSWADGSPGVTQCPIKPDSSFLHEFTATDQTGTYWYHSHLGLQYCDGLRGPLVIYDPDDPLQDLYDVDDVNTVITLSDWYHDPSLALAAPFAADSTLINGLGRYAGGPLSPLAVVNVDQGLRYRFRIVGQSCAPSFNFSIDGHLMTVIETDGIETEPLVVDSLLVFAGQRYSVVVEATQPVDNYWIRALSTNPNQTFDNGQSSAILRYAGAPEEDPTTEHGPYVLTYDEGDVHPLISPGAPGVPEPGKADVNINLVTGLANGQYTINGVPYSDPPLPILLQILSGARHPSQLLPKGSVIVLPLGKVIEVSIPATDLSPHGAIGEPHPLHLHGHTFDVVRTPGSSTYNFANPVRRDTISNGIQADNDNVTIRFTTDNPGPWFFHCHDDFHLHAGYAVVMAEAPTQLAGQDVPEDWEQLCDYPRPPRCAGGPCLQTPDTEQMSLVD